ncbi:MAG: OB-fold nucleic acid binding domain-containing protein [Candidatus Aenigmarchaeota archaeon]|nr:OB-fold nucleic acid binding domain-containing protein [Candidatus Aenigmarchaeota archaeon]
MNKINEQTIKKLCLVLAIFGILLIYISQATQNITSYKIKDIDETLVGEKVKVCGILREQKESSGGTYFVKLYDDKSIDVVFFKNNVFNIYDFDLGDVVCVTGRIKKYNGFLELIGEGVQRV